jgi:putative ABC transport system permease protein
VLVASGLLVRTVSRLMHAPTGVVAEHVVTATLQLEANKYPQWPAAEQFYTTLLQSVRNQPGIDAAGVSNAIALETGWRIPYAIDGRPASRAEEMPQAQIVTASSGYFEAFRSRLVAGRFFEDRDHAQTEPVVVINATLARREFPNGDAVGARIISTAQQIGPLGRNLMTSRDVHRRAFTIVGVVDDIQQSPIGQASEPVIYHTVRQFPFRAVTLVARGRDTATVVTGVRESLKSLDAAVPLSNVQTMDARLVKATAAPRLLMAVLVTFAVLTGVLAAVGVYGLLAWTVNDRKREMSIRLALGAQPASLARRVTAQGLGLVAAGVAVGLLGAQLAGGWLEQVLFQTRTTDMPTMVAAAALMLLAAVFAALAPARRIVRLAPLEGLRET